MKRLSWRDSATATAPPRVEVDRFRGTTRRTVHLLGEIRCIQTHRKKASRSEDQENTVPCLKPDPCPFCLDPLWHTRLEHFGPALRRNNADSIWQPIVAVFTPGGWNQFKRFPAGPHRGRLLSVFRTTRGSVTGGLLRVIEQSRIEPMIPAFDVEPHLLRMWFPQEEDLPPAEVPQAVPFTAEDVPTSAPKPEPFHLSEEERARVRAISAARIAEMRGEQLAEDLAAVEVPRGELGVTAIAADPANYSPRKLVAGGGGEGDVSKSAGAEILGEVLLKLPLSHPARRNGRAVKGGGS